MKRRLIQFSTAAAMAAGLALAQTQAPAPQPGHGRHGRAGMMNSEQRGAQHFERMATFLNLTPQQREQAKAIMDEAKRTAEPVREQLKANRQALADAVKTGKSEADIDRLATQQGVLMGQLTAIRTKALQKGYALLTPEQRQKADEMHSRMKEKFQQRSGQKEG